MEYRVGMIVEHPTEPWGPGKVLKVSGNKVMVHFRDDPGKGDYRSILVACRGT